MHYLYMHLATLVNLTVSNDGWWMIATVAAFYWVATCSFTFYCNPYLHKNIMIVGFDIYLCCYFTVLCFALIFQLIWNTVIRCLIVFLCIIV